LRRFRLSSVYALTDRRLAGLEAPEDVVAAFLEGGVRTIQLREKDLPDARLLEAARRARDLALGRNAALFIDDRSDVAKIVGCGVHLGDEDLPPGLARVILGASAAIGVSSHSVDAARKAFDAGTADYVAFGPIFASSIKGERAPLGLEELARAAREKTRPLVAIGGIGLKDLDAVWDAGADSAAMISALNIPPLAETARAAVDRGRRRFLPAKIWLVGFMGSGKTSVGRLLARRLGRPFFDLDEEIERASGRTVREIFESDGEAEFRRRERAYVEGTEALGAGVFAAGGGTFMSEENRRTILRSGAAVFLDVPFESLAARALGRADRPLFRDAAAARRLLDERLPFYKIATLPLRLDGTESPEQAAELVLERLEERTCVI
jgi:thiamine-phosphate diphosphorylase